MLVWSKQARFAVWAAFAMVFGVIYAAPVAIIVLASLAGQWNDVLPSHFTFANFGAALTGDFAEALKVSLITGAVASGVALLSGTWAALALRTMAPASRRILQVLFFLPSAVPSVSVGLGLLVAFSRPPVLLNGTVWIVLIAHFVLVSAFTFGNVSAGLARLAPEFEQVAASLGARPFYKLSRVTLPLLLPYLAGAFSLSFALSMGELGATVMVYPPGWVTMPVGIFALSDRGDVFVASALTIILAAVTMLVLLGLSRVSSPGGRRA